MIRKAKNKKSNNPAIQRIFRDLEAYLNFCREYGYRFNEADLYNISKYPFQQFNKFRNGKRAKDQWEIDRKRLC